MAAGDAGAWARLRLVQGASKTSSWELVSSQGETRLTVGRHASCQWVVDDPSVAPVHFTLRWDGKSLAVADSHRAGGIRLDGRGVGETFTRVAGRARLEFGRCAMVVETSIGGARLAQPLQLTSVPPPSSEASGSVPPRAASENTRPTSSRPPARTLIGVPLGAAADMPVREPSESVKVSRPVHTGSSTPSPSAASRRAGQATPTGPRAAPAPGAAPEKPTSDRPQKGTVVGLGPAPGASGPSASSAGDPGAGAASPTASAVGERPLGSTLYGLGERDEPAAVDVVSPARLRRSSVPAPQAPSSDSIPPGRLTEPGFADESLDRATRPGFAEPPPSTAAPVRAGGREPTPTDTRLVDDTGQMRLMSGQPHGAVAAAPTPPGSGGQPLAQAAALHATSGGYTADASAPSLHATGARRAASPSRARASTLSWVIGIAAALAFGVWVWALITL